MLILTRGTSHGIDYVQRFPESVVKTDGEEFECYQSERHGRPFQPMHGYTPGP